MITKEKIKEQFLVQAIEHGIAYSNGDYKKANKIHKKLHELYKKTNQNGFGDVFSEFINNEDENVRLWAAIFTLKTDEKIAIMVLNKLSKDSNIKMTAKVTLQLWEEGKLNLI